MGYSIDEWFCDNALPALKKTMERIEENESRQEEDLTEPYKTSYDIFMEEMRNLAGRYSDPYEDRFRLMLLGLILEEHTDLHEKIKTLFNLIAEEREIVELVYRDNYNLIRCEYNKLIDEE